MIDSNPFAPKVTYTVACPCGCGAPVALHFLRWLRFDRGGAGRLPLARERGIAALTSRSPRRWGSTASTSRAPARGLGTLGGPSAATLPSIRRASMNQEQAYEAVRGEADAARASSRHPLPPAWYEDRALLAQDYGASGHATGWRMAAAYWHGAEGASIRTQPRGALPGRGGAGYRQGRGGRGQGGCRMTTETRTIGSTNCWTGCGRQR